MIIYFGKTFSTTVGIGRFRCRRCESCGGDYVYSQTVVGTGEGSAVLGLGQKGAIKRARYSAELSLAKAKEKHFHSPAACPVCGAYPARFKAQMSKTYAEEWVRGLWKYGLAIFYFFAWGILAYYMLTNPYRNPDMPSWLRVVGAAAAAVPVSFFAGAPVFLAALIYCRMSWFHPWDVNSEEMRQQRIISPREVTCTRAEFDEVLQTMDVGTRQEVASLVVWPDQAADTSGTGGGR